jgi:hypothetical protein
MTTVIALKPHRYGLQRQIGDKYEVTSAADLRLVRALGWSKEAAPSAAPAKTAPYSRRDLVAAPAAELSTTVQTAEIGVAPAEDAPRPKRQYTRRNLGVE